MSLKKFNFKHYISISSFFIFFFLFSKLYASIGYIELIEGDVKLLLEEDQRELQELDEIFLNHRIVISDNSKLTILLDDGSTLFLKNKSEIIFLEYEDIFSDNPHYTIEVIEGEIYVETGELPKFKKNSTKIITPIGHLFLNGTAISAKLKDELSEIFLMTDSFGESGEVVLENEDGNTLSIEINSGLKINEEGVNTINLSDEVISNQNDIKKVIANSAIANEDKIDEIIKKKIESGNLTSEEAKLYKDKIVKKKEKKIEQIISSSKTNTAILGEVLKNAEGDVGSKIIEKVVDKNPKLTSKVLDTVIQNNENLFKDIASNNTVLTEKILNTIVAEADEKDESLSKIIANTDNNISAQLVNGIAETKKELMIKVVSETSTLNPEKIRELTVLDEEINTKITSVIVESLTESAEATEDLKEIILNADAKLTNEIIKQTVSLDNDLVSQATSEIFLEEKEKITEKLSESIEDNNDSTFNSLIISSAIESGNVDIVSKAVEMNVQKKINNDNQQLATDNALATQQNNIQNSNQPNQEDTINNEAREEPISDQNNTIESISTENMNEVKENILKVNNLINQEINKLKTTNPELNIDDKILINVDEVLASPN